MNEKMNKGLYVTFGLALLLVLPFQTAGCAGPVDDVNEERKSEVQERQEKHKSGLKKQAAQLELAAAGQKAAALADGKYKEEGKYFDKDDIPIYNLNEKGQWDWLTYNGNRRYHAECHVCHGFAGGGSSFAPSLTEAMKRLSYDEFREVVTNGRKVEQPDGSFNIMPTFGTNKNVMCFIDDLYVYLKARADGAMAAVAHRNLKKEAKAKEIREEESACFGD